MIDFILAAVANFKNLLIEYYTPVFFTLFLYPINSRKFTSRF